MFIITILSTIALAQSSNESSTNVQEIDFGAVSLTGEQMRPSGAIVNERPKSQFPPITDIRVHFHNELLQSVNAIQ